MRRDISKDSVVTNLSFFRCIPVIYSYQYVLVLIIVKKCQQFILFVESQLLKILKNLS